MTRTRIGHSIPNPEERDHGPTESNAKKDHEIKGNVSEKLKNLVESIFIYFIDAKGNSFGAEVGRRLKIMEINISGIESSQLSLVPDADLAEKQRLGNGISVETIFEMTVDKDMCNVRGTLHGGCAAYIIDPCSNAPLVTLGLLIGLDGTGVSQSMNLIWHNPIHIGAKIVIKATSMHITGRIRTARCEIWTENNLCVSAVHSTINPREKNKRFEAKL